MFLDRYHMQKSCKIKTFLLNTVSVRQLILLKSTWKMSYEIMLNMYLLYLKIL